MYCVSFTSWKLSTQTVSLMYVTVCAWCRFLVWARRVFGFRVRSEEKKETCPNGNGSRSLTLSASKLAPIFEWAIVWESLMYVRVQTMAFSFPFESGRDFCTCTFVEVVSNFRKKQKVYKSETNDDDSMRRLGNSIPHFFALGQETKRKSGTCIHNERMRGWEKTSESPLNWAREKDKGKCGYDEQHSFEQKKYM